MHLGTCAVSNACGVLPAVREATTFRFRGPCGPGHAIDPCSNCEQQPRRDPQFQTQRRLSEILIGSEHAVDKGILWAQI